MRRRSAIAALLAGASKVQAAPPSLYALALSFTDDQGRTQPLSAWQGQPVVLSMAYGACRRICSTTLRRLESLHDEAERRRIALQFVVASLDPAEDRPQDWAEYRRLRRLDAPNWHFLCGSPQATHALARFIGLRFWAYDDHVMHDFGIVRLDEAGRITAALRWVDEDVQRLL